MKITHTVKKVYWFINTFFIHYTCRAETERDKTLHSAEQIQDSFEKYQKRIQEKLEKVRSVGESKIATDAVHTFLQSPFYSTK